jgi:hypothetical protein
MNSSSTTRTVGKGRTAVLIRRVRCVAVTAIAVLGPLGFLVVETAGIFHP